MAEITIIVPAYNAAPFIEPTLESALTQDFFDIELIAVDDGSTDETAHVLEAAAARDTRVIVVSHPNMGVSGARNSGVRSASSTTNAVLFLDHDDVLLPRALTRLSKALYANPTASAAHGLATVIDADGRPAEGIDPKSLGLTRRRLPEGKGLFATARSGASEPPESEPTTFATLVYSSCITSPGQVLIRGSALRQTGGFDPTTAPSDDWDLYLRLTRVGPMAYLSDPVLGWRRHDSNASRDLARMKQSSYSVRRKLIDRRSNLNAADLAIVRRQFAYTAMALLASALRRDGKTDTRKDLAPAMRLYLRSLFTRSTPWTGR